MIIREELDIAYENIFIKMNKAFWEGDFKSVDEELRTFPLDKNNWELAIAMLCYSKCAKEHLPNRKNFYDRLIELVLEIGGQRLIQLYIHLE